MADVLCQQGLGGLAEPDLTEPRPGDRTWAAEFLTARYATNPSERQAWRWHLRRLPDAEALAAASRDDRADRVVRIAALTLAPVVRAAMEVHLDRIEYDLIRGLRADGQEWTTSVPHWA
ncbi:hypothetical protein [Nonomuraea jabiensis]|uniref:hypothetical protein n=1 Tax=Nonomuraea jabiensis TaxID=882448 RepID=UPI003D75CD02